MLVADIRERKDFCFLKAIKKMKNLCKKATIQFGQTLGRGHRFPPHISDCFLAFQWYDTFILFPTGAPSLPFPMPLRTQDGAWIHH